jgi:hypothetical protein
MTGSRALVAAAALLSLAGLAGCGGQAKAAGTASRLPAGLFKLTAGHCTTATAKPTGSYLIVISAAENKAAKNPRGGCANPDYTPLTPGSDGGLVIGRFQSQPSPVFDARRNSRADRIITPVDFDGFRFGFATTPLDEQDAPAGEPTYPAPAAIVTGTTLNLDLRSLVVTYAGQPSTSCKQSYGVGCWELGSKSASGTYDAATHHYEIDWFAGESFTSKGDSIEVHLEGTFVPGSSP